MKDPLIWSTSKAEPSNIKNVIRKKGAIKQGSTSIFLVEAAALHYVLSFNATSCTGLGFSDSIFVMQTNINIRNSDLGALIIRAGFWGTMRYNATEFNGILAPS